MSTYSVGLSRFPGYVSIYDENNDHVADIKRDRAAQFLAIPDMFEALKDVASSGLIECTCTSDTCAGSCTITLVRKAIQKAEGK